MNSQPIVDEGTSSKASAVATQLPVRALICPICNTQDWEYAQKVRGASISNCVHCGLLGTTNFLTGVNTTEGLYETSQEEYADYRQYFAPRRLAMYERVIPSLERFRKTGRLLEIGCSYGYFLETARRARWEAEGVEISGYACQVARSKGFQIYQEELRSLSPRLKSYDVIAMWDVIEHLTDPSGIVECCAGLLSPGGALVVRTPNAHALATGKGLARLAYTHLVYPANTRQHVFHFTPESLTQLLRHKGFRECEIDEYGGWEERIISQRNPLVRIGRQVIMRYALYRQWPYEFSITAVKDSSE
jgi:2-polyprenyl-3-methyl-5-hydroxy-6-metoxy-1,4-benzoquinol methylase